MWSGGRREHRWAKGMDILLLLTEYPSGLVLAEKEVILGTRAMGCLAGKATCSDEQEDRRLLSFMYYFCLPPEFVRIDGA